jgi:hypothetical protein
MSNHDKIDLSGILLVSDPVETHIMEHLSKLQSQNERYLQHIQKTSKWVNIKDISVWKPYDFYHYFTNKYEDKYGVGFKLKGNITTVYRRIEKFVFDHELKNEDYKNFIDVAFSSYFNSITKPVIGTLCSESLFEHLMGGITKRNTSKDLLDLDTIIEEESKKFEEDLEEISF